MGNLADQISALLDTPQGMQSICELIKCSDLEDSGNKQHFYGAALSYLRMQDGTYDALALLWAIYEKELRSQVSDRVHKGTTLFHLSDCFNNLGWTAHAKRYLMLTLCEDAVEFSGKIDPAQHGVYARLAWQHGLSNAEITAYADSLFQRSASLDSSERGFPEALLLKIEDDWIQLPTASEAFSYKINPMFANSLLIKLGDGTGNALESLARYLMSCMPGCRTMQRAKTWSTDYDLVCAMEGLDLDFRSELGRYFVCECKDWSSKAGFATMAKFCRVLDSVKSRFGILFSKNNISGKGDAENAEREQLKVFQDRGVVIVVFDEEDLKSIISGKNLISMMRKRYEAIRLDLRPAKS